jgi:hypothetical protein
MFKPLSDLIARLRGKQTPHDNAATFDMSREQLSQLATLRTYEEYAALIALADKVAAYRAEAMLFENDPIKNAFARGRIAAIRELPLLIERLALQVKDARERAAVAAADERNDTRRAASLYGTPQWSGRSAAARHAKQS